MRVRELKTERVVAETIETHGGVAYATETDVATAKAEAIATAAAPTTMPKIPIATVAAAGEDQAAAAAVATGFTLVSAADDAKGVKLPTAAAGLVCIIKNNVSAKNLLVYPNTSDKINGGLANAALTMAGLTSAMFVAYDAVDWYSLPLLPS